MLSSMTAPSDASADATSPRAPSATPAHLGWRLLAMTYDLLPLIALWFATSLVVYLARGEHEVRPGTLAAWMELTLLWIVTGAYFVACWSRGGHTVGMRPWRLRVLTEDGRKPTLRSSCVRYIVATGSLLAVGIGFVWSLLDPERRTWHDLASGTRLVRMDRSG